MSVKEIEEAILKLPPRELSKLTDWLLEYRAKSWDMKWDMKIEKDLDNGKLDEILDEVDKEYEAGLATFL